VIDSVWLGEIEDRSRSLLDLRYERRERALASSRRVIRASANAIRHLHRGENDAAAALLDGARTELGSMLDEVASDRTLVGAGFVSDAAKEFAEASLTFAIFEGRRPPDADDLGVPIVPYLHGLGEAVGEMRRRLLDLLRAGGLDGAEMLLVAMNDIVDLLASLDYPNGMTSGLRRTTDVARSLTERSRADLTATVVQERLRADLSEHTPE